jgi:hypothetical protein
MNMVAIQLTFTTSSMTEDMIGQGCCPPSPAMLACSSSHFIEEGCIPCSSTELRQVAWPNKFKPGPIDKYDSSSNPEEFIQVYHMVIKSAGNDDQVKANYLPMTYPTRPDLGLLTFPNVPSTTGTSYVACSSGTHSAHTSVPPLLKP